VNDDGHVGGKDLAHRECARLVDGHGRPVRAHHEHRQVADVRPVRCSAPVVVSAGRHEIRTGAAAHVVQVHPMEAWREGDVGRDVHPEHDLAVLLLERHRADGGQRSHGVGNLEPGRRHRTLEGCDSRRGPTEEASNQREHSNHLN
jgi:hypothetical protein